MGLRILDKLVGYFVFIEDNGNNALTGTSPKLGFRFRFRVDGQFCYLKRVIELNGRNVI